MPLVYFAVALWLFRSILIARKTRERVRYKAKSLMVYAMVLFVARGILLSHHYSENEAGWFAVPIAISAAMLFVRRPRKDRYIPKHVRRRVIERDLKGEPFDPNKHAIDHIVTHKAGGDNSIENLRVVSKQYNLRRGARKPTMRDLLGFRPKD